MLKLCAKLSTQDILCVVLLWKTRISHSSASLLQPSGNRHYSMILGLSFTMQQQKIPVTNGTMTYQFCVQCLAETITLMSCLVQGGGLTNCRWNLFGSALKKCCQGRLNCLWKARNAVFSGVLVCDFIFLCGFLPFQFMFFGNYLRMIIWFSVTACENE